MFADIRIAHKIRIDDAGNLDLAARLMADPPEVLRVELARLPYRAPYNRRHTFAYWSLRAGDTNEGVAREMGHRPTEQTFKVYGGWCREMGADAAALRSAWASGAIVEPDTLGGES